MEVLVALVPLVPTSGSMLSILLSEFLKHYRKPIPQISTNLKPITCQKGGLNGSLKSYPGFLQRMKAALHLDPYANRSVHKLS